MSKRRTSWHFEKFAYPRYGTTTTCQEKYRELCHFGPDRENTMNYSVTRTQPPKYHESRHSGPDPENIMNSVAAFGPENTMNFVIPGLTRNPANNSHALTLLDTRFRGYDEYGISSPPKPIGNID